MIPATLIIQLSLDLGTPPPLQAAANGTSGDLDQRLGRED